MSNLITPPYQNFQGINGLPLENGYIYVGEEFLNPITNPVSIFWDKDFTIPAAQPIRTINGYPSRNGSPSNFFTNVNYSILVQDRNNVFVFSALSSNYPIYQDNLPWFDALNYGDGSKTATTIRAAINAIKSSIGSSTKFNLLLRRGEWDFDITETSESTVNFLMENGFQANVTDSNPWTINGTFDSSLSKVFNTSGAGAVVIGGATPILYPEFFGAISDGSTDNLASIQATHDSLPSTGGTIYFSEGSYMITGTDRYVAVTKDNITIEMAPDAEVVSQNSDDPDATTGGAFNIGFYVTADNFKCKNTTIRGGLISMDTTTGDIASFDGCKFYNLHNAGVITIGNFRHIDFNNCTFDVSLATTAANFSAIQAGDDSGDGFRDLVTVRGCNFRSLAGGINIHALKKLVVDSSSFVGINYFSIKTDATVLTSIRQDMSFTNCYLDGQPVDSGSPNRHIADTGDGTRVVPGSSYAFFLNNFNTVGVIGNTFKSFNSYAIDFVDVTRVNSSLTILNNTFDTCAISMSAPCGNASIRGNTFRSCGAGTVEFSDVCYVRQCLIEENLFYDSSLYVTDFGWDAKQESFTYISKNTFYYSLDDDGAIYVETGAYTHFGKVIVEGNNIYLLNSIVVAIKVDSGSVALIGNNFVSLASGSETVPTNGIINFRERLINASGTFSTTLFGPKTLGYTPNRYRIINESSGGIQTYTLNDESFNVNDEVSVERFHASNQIVFQISDSGTIDGRPLIRATVQFANGVLKKLSDGVWILLERSRTWTYS